MNVFKFLKKLVTRENGADGKPVDTTKVETTEISGTTEVEIDGKMVRLNDLAKVWMDQTASAATSRANGEDEVEIDGKPVKMNALVDCYKKNAAAAAARTNAADADAVKAAADKAVADKAAADAAAKKSADESFFTLHSRRDNAATTVNDSAGPVTTGAGNSGSLRDRCERAKGRY